VSVSNRQEEEVVSGADPSPVTLLAMAALAAAIMVYELALTRIFSFTIWHHFAFMVLSVALLGFAAAGVAHQLRSAGGGVARRRAAWASVAFALSALVAVRVVVELPFDAKEIARQPQQLAWLFAHYACLLVPFSAAGFAVLSLLSAYPRRVANLYASDLAGAGFGCLWVVGLMSWIGAAGAVVLAAAVAATSAWLLRREEPGHSRWLLVAIGLIAAVPLSERLLPIRPGAGKSLEVWLDKARFPQARVVATHWDALWRVDVVEDTGVVRWTQHPLRRRPQPAQTQIVIDGDAATPIVTAVAGEDLSFLDDTLSSLALQALKPRHVLVIGAGGGLDVHSALRSGAARVDAVEINPTIAKLMTETYAERSGGVLLRPEVTLHVAEGRSFVRRSTERFDLIQLSLIDTWAAAGAGAYSLSESYLYTVEAFVDYFEHLQDGGVLTVTRWLQEQPRETLKVCTVAAAALRRLGVAQPEDHIVVAASGNLANVMIKRTPFGTDDLEALARVADEREFGFVYAPGIQGKNDFVEFFQGDAAQFIDAYPFDLTPPVDDSPFFFQFGRWRDALPWSTAWQDRPSLLSARLVLVAVLVQAVLFGAVALVLPMVVRRTKAAPAGRRAVATFGYFFLVGVAFMLLEVALMQRFTLFLGHPIYALALVLAVLLLSAGAGSTLASNPRVQRHPQGVFVSIVGLTLLYAAILPWVQQVALGWAEGVRAVAAAGLIAPLGIALGIPFPLALARSIGTQGEGAGWAWAANGCGSVVGPILAVMLAIDLGFTAVLVIAAVTYGTAAALLPQPAPGEPGWRYEARGSAESRPGGTRPLPPEP